MISYLLIFFSLLASGGALVILGYSILLHFLVITIAIVKIFTSKKVVVAKRSILFYAFLTSIFLILMALRGEDLYFSDNASVLARLGIGLLLCVALENEGVEVVLKKFTKAFEVICVISLILWVPFNVPFLREVVSFPLDVVGKHRGFQEVFQCDVNYRSIFFLAYSKNCDYEKFGFVRNHAIFWEPGVLAFFCVYFLIIKFLYLKDIKNLWIYFVTSLTTFSMGGVLIFAVVAYSIWRLKRLSVASPLRKLGFFFTMSLVLFLTITVVAAGGLDEILRIIGIMFGRDLMTDSSAQVRFYDFYYGIKASLENPWLGSGRDYSLYNEHLLANTGVSKSAYEGGMTNAVVSLFYRYGVFFWIAYMFSLFVMARYVSRFGSLMIFTFFVLLLMYEPLDTCIVILFSLYFIREPASFKADTRHRSSGLYGIR